MTEERRVVLEKALLSHPCYTEAAHHKFARMHIPVAPRCNIQCNYCNRKYDCSNESRPGVTSEVLTPEQALAKVRMVKEKIPELKVVAVAGPGDPLANEETFQSMAMIAEEFPEMTLCISTNGLMLPDNVDRLWDLGIRFVTVTINAIDPEVAKDIYQFVNYNGQHLKDLDAARTLIGRQLLGVEKCVAKGMVVKINMVLIPGINNRHIPLAVKRFKELGVYIVNILPLIPVEGTRFESLRAPSAKERKELQDLCANDVRMMRHCKQCRADAIGLLGNDRSQEFSGCGSGCGPTGGARDVPVLVPRENKRIAVASSDGEQVDGGFGNSPRFRIYEHCKGEVTSLGMVELNRDLEQPLYGEGHHLRLETAVQELADNDVIIVTGIGDKARSDLERRGVKIHISHGSVQQAIAEAVGKQKE
ncbi:MAG: nitrogenase cofactor biosynthesis protein NifB [Candidatus Methanomethylophilaceae archaeon]|nr:nitrogenase cofactor biosynthesis protein NifB [Candidatus Methanomethylophilaceae archaeon]